MVENKGRNSDLQPFLAVIQETADQLRLTVSKLRRYLLEKSYTAAIHGDESYIEATSFTRRRTPTQTVFRNQSIDGVRNCAI